MLENQIFLKYPPNRDVVFVLGAGASHPDGVPLQNDLLPMLLSGEINELNNSFIGNEVINFIKENFYYKAGKSNYPRLEAVFGFLDYFIQHDESLNAHYTTTKLIEIKEYLIKVIHYLVDLRTDKRSPYYHLFWELIFKYNSNISVLTMNYDTLLEQAFEDFYQTKGYIDYRIHFMNYESTAAGKHKLTKWINASEPVIFTGNIEPVPLKIIKLHGSLNWKYCNCCNQVLITPWDRKIDLNKGKFLGYTYPDKQEYEYACPLDNTDFNTLIIPPTYLKTLVHPIISQLIRESSREIRSAKKIIFLGYSLSNSDIHIKALFKKHLQKGTEIVVINPVFRKSQLNNYKALSENVKFLEIGFEESLKDEAIFKELLTIS